MARFKYDDRANVMVNGQELEVVVVSVNEERDLGGNKKVVYYVNGGGQQFPVREARMLPLRGPYFDVRGLVLTISAKHPNEIGEIVSTGHSPAKTRYFKVKFQNGDIEWFNENEVFIEHQTKEAE
jgi:hypothetical protein